MTPAISRHSIRLKLTAAVAMAISGFGIAFVAVSYLWIRSANERDIEAFALHEIDEVASIIAATTQIEPGHRTALDRLIPEEGVVSLGIWSVTGEQVLGMPAGPDGPAPWPEGLERAASGLPAFAALDPPGGPRQLRAARLVQLGSEPRWIVTSTVSRAEMDQALVDFLVYSIGSVVVTALIVVTGAWALLNRAITPFREVVGESVELAKHRRGSLLATPPDGSEVAELTRLLNGMLLETRTTHERLRRFSSDVSHELRTPLMRVRGELETVLDSHDVERMRGAVGSVLDEVDALARLIDALLDLARDDDASPQDLPPIDLSEIVMEVAGEAEVLASEQGVSVSVRACPPVWVRGSRPLLSRVLWNLIDNAIRVAHPRGRVEIAIGLGADHVAIDVEDDGPGLPSDCDPETLFEPFVRGPRAPDSEPGYGLGLALSRAIARRHGGGLHWGTSEKLGGARLRLVLPIERG